MVSEAFWDSSLTISIRTWGAPSLFVVFSILTILAPPAWKKVTNYLDILLFRDWFPSIPILTLHAYPGGCQPQYSFFSFLLQSREWSRELMVQIKVETPLIYPECIASGQSVARCKVRRKWAPKMFLIFTFVVFAVALYNFIYVSLRFSYSISRLENLLRRRLRHFQQCNDQNLNLPSHL